MLKSLPTAACPFTCFDMPEVTDCLGMGCGGEPLSADGDGIALGGDSDAPAVVLQIHYDNMQKKDLIDPGSGIPYDVKKPTNEASVLGIGSVALADFSIPGDTTNTRLPCRAGCHYWVMSRCTDGLFICMKLALGFVARCTVKGSLCPY